MADAATYLLPTVKREVGGDDSAHLKRLLGAAIAFVAKETGLSLSSSSEQKVYLDGGHGTEALWLPEAGTVSRVEIRSAGSAWDEVPAADYVLEGRRLIRSDGTRWPRGHSNLRITMTSGPTSEAEWHQDLLQVVIDLVGMLYRTRRSARPTGLAPDEEMRGGMGPWHWRVLKDHRPQRIG